MMGSTATMTDTELAAILRDEARAAVSFRDTALADEQANALDYYEAEPFGDEQDGRSQVVVPDVQEVVDYMQVSVLRTCVSGDHVVEFEAGDTDQVPEMPDPPEKPPADDPQAMQAYQQAKAQHDAAMKPFRDWERRRVRSAEDATEAVNYIFMRRQDGYNILLSWLQSGLIEKLGVIKTVCEVDRKKTKRTVQIPAEGLAMLAEEGVPLASAPEEQEDGSFLCVVEEVTETKAYRDYPIPSEEYLFSARTRDEDTSDYQAHRVRKTISDLIEMGFDRDVVEALPVDDNEIDTDVRAYERWKDETGVYVNRPLAMRRVRLMEEYVRLDRDGDGIAELLKVFRVDDTILEVEEIEEAPFVTWTPFPRAHRMVGNSLAEKVMDIQRVNSVLLRQALDGTYLTNAPRMWVPDECVTDETFDDLLTVRVGGIVRGKGAGGIRPERLNEPFDIQKSLGMMEFMQGQRETRTGITRLNQGLDEDTLNKTASGQAALQATGQQMEEFVARNFAGAMARLFAKKLRLMAENGNPIAIRVDGNYRRVDPSAWDRDMNVATRVGLGSGRKDQRLAYRTQLLAAQREALPMGLTNAKKLYNNAAAIVRDAGLGSPAEYWVDPDSDEYQAPQPQQDPAAAKAQGDAQIAQARLQLDTQQAEHKQQLSQAQAEADLAFKREMAAIQIDQEQQAGENRIRLDREKADADAALARDKADFEAQLARENADRDFELRRDQIERDHELRREQAAADHAFRMTAAEGLPRNRPGGDLSK